MTQNLVLSDKKGWCRVAFSLVGAQVEIPRQEHAKDPVRSARAKRAWERRKGFQEAQLSLFYAPAPVIPVEPRKRRQSMTGPLVLLMVLRGLSRPDTKEEWCHASLETLAGRTGKCRRTVWSWLRILEGAGLLERQVTKTNAAGQVMHGGGWLSHGVGRATTFRLTELAWSGFPTGKEAMTAKDQPGIGMQHLPPTTVVQDQIQPPLTPPPNPGKVEVSLSEAKAKSAPEAPVAPTRTAPVAPVVTAPTTPAATPVTAEVPTTKPAPTKPQDAPPGHRWHADRIREDLLRRAYPAPVVEAALVELASRPDVVARRTWTEAVAKRRVEALAKERREVVRGGDLRAKVEQIAAAAVPERSGYGGDAGETWARECLAKKVSGRRLLPWEVRAASCVNNNVLASA